MNAVIPKYIVALIEEAFERHIPYEVTYKSICSNTHFMDVQPRIIEAYVCGTYGLPEDFITSTEFGCKFWISVDRLTEKDK